MGKRKAWEMEFWGSAGGECSCGKVQPWVCIFLIFD